MGIKSALGAAATRARDIFEWSDRTLTSTIVGGYGQDDIDFSGARTFWELSTIIMACLQLRMNAISQVEWGIVDSDGDEYEGAAPFDMERPNPGMSRFAFLQHIVLDLGLYGNVYIWTDGPNGLTFLRAEGIYLHDGVWQTMDGGLYPQESVLHIYQPSPGPRDFGLSRLNSLGGSTQIMEYMRGYVADWFKTGGQMGAVVSVDSDQRVRDEDIDTMRRNLEKMAYGIENRHKVAVIGMKSTFHQLTHDLAALSSMEMRQQVELDVLQAFNTSRFLVESSLSEATGLGTDVASTANQNYWRTTLQPILDHIASEFTWYFGGELQGRRIQFDYSRIPEIQQLHRAQQETALQAFEVGLITPQAAVRQLGSSYTEDDIAEGAGESEPVLPM